MSTLLAIMMIVVLIVFVNYMVYTSIRDSNKDKK